MALNTFATPIGSSSAQIDGQLTRKLTHPSRPASPGRQSSDETEVEQAEVRDLARTWTERSRRQSTASEAYGNPFDAEKGSILDPDSDTFDPRAWTKAMLRLQDEDDTKFKGRKAGVAFRSLNAYGYSTGADFQKTVGNFVWQIWGAVQGLTGRSNVRVDILRELDGVVYPGELLVVLGPPGSGCSTFLKTLAGETHGYTVDSNSYLNYSGISYEQLKKNFRGESMYTAEQDVHFPMLTVGKTLYFAARARAPRFIPGGASIKQYSEHMRDVIMATFGIKHTLNTRVGNDFVRGVSGGERKRVSIAEASLCNAPLQMWDNSTRGLDSANAIEFVKNLRIQTKIKDVTVAVAIYQAPQAAYDIFDKVLLLYEGRQIFFGPTTQAKQYFLNMGFGCPDRQTDADFLTSMTAANERVVKAGFENKVPRTSDEFAGRWRDSKERKILLGDIDEFGREYPVGGASLEEFQQSMRLHQAKNARKGSPYTLSYLQQVKLCLWRAMVQLIADPSIMFTQLFGNFIMSLVIASVFYNLDVTAGSFFSRGALLFFAILMGAFGSALEILSRYSQRPIVEKHSRYALYHPSAEAIASMLSDMPYKILNAVTFNLPLYFMTNLRREPGAFFFFLLISFTMTLTMSMLFRGVASVSRTLEQALAPAGLAILALVIYTGFAIPTTYMLGWARWINYINPVAYGFEALMINEFSGQTYLCTAEQLLPPYPDAATDNQICSSVGAQPGQPFIEGSTYLREAYDYNPSNRWRNYGILWAFLIGLLLFHVLTTEFISAKKSKGEVLVWRRGQVPASAKAKNRKDDVEAPNTGNCGQTEKKGQDISNVIQKQTAIFQWHDVCYDIKIKSEDRRILDHVDGWVKPGTLTALMGVSGAGKTTLLDVLATRVTMGVISGEMLVDGRTRDSSFQRKTGYVQQQDLHLQTSTVREALKFSAVLRQLASTPYKEKVAYVDEVIKLLDMEEYADAIIGVPGEGLNVEQRKRLTIGVELAAKPQLLLFLDEPTSGLDSQTSWSILNLLEKLANNGQAILCTIHQPSAVLFQRFDRLLFLAKGGKTVYFGPIGESSSTLTSYFEHNGAHQCPPEANPAEWILEVIGAAPGSHSDIDWPATWRSSPEYQGVLQELETMKNERSKMGSDADSNDKANYREFAAPFALQYLEVQKRVWQQHWRTPTYIYAKISMCVFAALFIGFSFFRADNTQQGLQNQMFGIFMLMSIFGQLVQQLMPLFVGQRALYEVRERPSKAYSWKAFMLSNIFVEAPWNMLCGTLLFFCWYYPIGLWRNAEPSDAVHERGALMWLLVVSFLFFTTTFAHMVIAAVESAETGGNIANVVFSLSLIFCGVLATPGALPGFWIFMYRVSPFTYLISAMLSTAVSGAPATCADTELRIINPPDSQTCQQYLAPFLEQAGGTLGNPEATSGCEYCGIETTDLFLDQLSINSADDWRNFGLMWVYIVFNIAAALALYWLGRMPHNWGKKKN